MREIIRELLDDLPEAVITAAVVAFFECVLLGWAIIAATPVPQ